MKYTDLIFDLYGTLVDIHTEENDTVWEKTAIFFGFYGAHYTGAELKSAFQYELKKREAVAGQDYECYPDIPCEEVFASLFRCKGVSAPETLGTFAAQLFRISSMEYIRLYPGVLEALEKLRKAGCRLWLLSNAQRVFTAYELRHLQLGAQFDGIYISSDHGCRKPDRRFLGTLLQEQHLDVSKCLMIGNDRETDIAGATALGLDTLYMHTALTPSQQDKANEKRQTPHHFEFEGDDWNALGDLLMNLIQKCA